MLRRRSPRAAAAVALLAVGLGVAACGGEDDDTADPSGNEAGEPAAATGPDTTAVATSTSEEQALQIYRASHDVVIRAAASNPPAFNDPALFDHFTGTALQETVNYLTGLVNINEYTQITRDVDPFVVTGNDQEVLLEDCVTETYQGFDSATDEPTESGTATINSRIRMLNTPDGWRVDQITHQEAPCS